MDRNNLLIDIMNTLSSLRIKCTEVSAKLFPDNIKCGIYCQICVANLAELDKTFAVLKTVKSVIDVKRLFH